MKKILHIIDHLWLWWAQTVVKWFFEIQNLNNNILLYALRKVDINTKINNRNIILNDSNNKYNFPINQLRNIIIQNKIEVIHCHLAKSQIIWYLLKKLFFPNIKLILQEHWQIFQEWKIYPFLMNSFRKKVDLFIAVSEATKNKILEKTKYDSNKIEILYNFVDLNKFKKIEIENNKYWFTNNDLIVWFASRLYEWKWYKEFIESADILLKKWYKLKFILAWDWPDKNYIIDFINKNDLSKSIKLIGYVNDMIIFYNSINCFVFPSHRESLWLTGIEANACACPVVASNIEGLNEIMINEKNALLFIKKDSKDLSEKIEKIFNNTKLRDNLIKNWLEEVKKYSLEKYIIKLSDIYEKL